MLWWPLIELLFSLRRAMLRISPGGFPLFKSYSMFSSLPSLSLSLSLCSKAYHQAAIQCFHHCLPFTFYSGDDAVHLRDQPIQIGTAFFFHFLFIIVFHFLFNAMGIMLEAILERYYTWVVFFVSPSSPISLM